MILSKIRIVFSNKYFHFGILYHYNAIAGDDFSILNIMWLKYSIHEKEGVKKVLKFKYSQWNISDIVSNEIKEINAIRINSNNFLLIFFWASKTR